MTGPHLAPAVEPRLAVARRRAGADDRLVGGDRRDRGGRCWHPHRLQAQRWAERGARERDERASLPSDRRGSAQHQDAQRADRQPAPRQRSQCSVCSAAIADRSPARENIASLGPRAAMLRLPSVRASRRRGRAGGRCSAPTSSELRIGAAPPRRGDARNSTTVSSISFAPISWLMAPSSRTMDWRFAGDHRQLRDRFLAFAADPAALRCCPRSIATSTASAAIARSRRTGCRQLPSGWRACGAGSAAEEPCCPAWPDLRPTHV